jgi:hypothetical protein
MRRSIRNWKACRRVGSRILAIGALGMFATGCHDAGKGASSVTQDEGRQLDQAAADLDANTVDSNAVDLNASPSGDQSQ